VFSLIYEKLLVQDLKEFTTWNSGILSHNIGPNFKIKNLMKNPMGKPTQRHRKVIKDPGFRKYTQTVPDMHKIDPKSIQVLDDLKVTPGKKILSQDELQKICTKFGVSRLNTQEPKNLGNTGITLRFDPDVRGYVLQK